METVKEDILQFITTPTEEEVQLPDWSNGTGYGDGYGEGEACGGIVQKGCGVGFSEDLTDALEYLEMFNGEPVYHIAGHPIIIYKVLDENTAKGAVIRVDMTLCDCTITREGDIFTIREDLENNNNN